MSYLKDASARKDSDGNYYLFIEADGLNVFFLLSSPDDGEDSITRRCLSAWLAKQDKENGKNSARREVGLD